MSQNLPIADGAKYGGARVDCVRDAESLRHFVHVGLSAVGVIGFRKLRRAACLQPYFNLTRYRFQWTLANRPLSLDDALWIPSVLRTLVV